MFVPDLVIAGGHTSLPFDRREVFNERRGVFKASLMNPHMYWGDLVSSRHVCA